MFYLEILAHEGEVRDVWQHGLSLDVTFNLEAVDLIGYLFIRYWQYLRWGVITALEENKVLL